MSSIEPGPLAPSTRKRVEELLDRMIALVDDFERDLDDPVRRAVTWARLTGVHTTIEEILRDEGALDEVDVPPPAEREVSQNSAFEEEDMTLGGSEW
jgi:hypothetical protein